MRGMAIIAALLAVAAAQPGWTAEKAKPRTAAACAPEAAQEAEQAIRYLTDLMVISSTCQNTVYAEFRLRNRDAIVGYQKALIARFHGAAGFDHWNTALANQIAQRHAGVLTLCQDSAPLLKQATTLDLNGFRAYAAAQAASAIAANADCKTKK